MNYKKHLLALVCLLMMVMLTLTACGKSSSSGTTGNKITKSSVVGTYHTSHSGELLIIKPSGVYYLTQVADSKHDAGTFSGAWLLSGNKIKLKIKGKYYAGTVRSDGTIKDNNSEIWTKQ